MGAAQFKRILAPQKRNFKKLFCLKSSILLGDVEARIMKMTRGRTIDSVYAKPVFVSSAIYTVNLRGISQITKSCLKPLKKS